LQNRIEIIRVVVMTGTKYKQEMNLEVIMKEEVQLNMKYEIAIALLGQ